MHYEVLADRVRYFKETEEGASAMCEAMELLTDEAEKRGMERGMERGRERGLQQGKESERIFSIRNIMANLQLTAEKAMDVLSIPKSEQARYKAML